MIIVIGLLICFVVCFILWRVFGGRSYDNWGIAPMISGMCLGVALLGIVGNHIEVVSKTQKFNATVTTINYARENRSISIIELAAVQRDVIECNQWLASNQYWAKNLWTSWFVPRAVLDLKPIK